MGIRTTIWAGFFFGTCLGAFWNPIWGILGYMGHYTVGPERQWWAAPVNALALRYSFTLAACTAIGILLHRTEISFKEGLLHPQQKLILLFLGVVWLTTLLTPDTVGRYTTVDHPSVKFTKVVLFCLMLSHCATNVKDLNRVLGILVIGAFVLGQRAYEMPRSAFVSGRLNNVGGPDFAESNFLAAFLVAVLPIIGAQFLRSDRWMKAMCIVSGVFVANALVLCRSRGAFLGLGLTVFVAVLYAPKRMRKKIYAGLILAVCGGLYLADDQFLQRMTTISADEEEQDASSNARLKMWQGGIRMFIDNPLGIGTGNWYQKIRRYHPNPTHMGALDAHSTYIKLASEQGILGILVFGSFVASAFMTLRRVSIRSKSLSPALSVDFQYLSFGLTLSLVGFLLCCCLITLLYMEATWWFLTLPACLERSLDDAEKKWLDGEACHESASLPPDEKDTIVLDSASESVV